MPSIHEEGYPIKDASDFKFNISMIKELFGWRYSIVLGTYDSVILGCYNGNSLGVRLRPSDQLLLAFSEGLYLESMYVFLMAAYMSIFRGIRT